MLLWIAFALLTAVVLAVLLWPVMRAGEAVESRVLYDLNVYRDQLAELERDEGAGLIAGTEAAAARAEISRRMLQADQAQPGADAASPDHGRTWALVAGVLVPVVALAGYLATGNPQYRDVPRAERIAQAVDNNDLPALIAQVEARLAQSPEDAQGWAVLAPAYRRVGRFADAAQAFARAVELNAPDAALSSDYGEALVVANDGMITQEARKAFDRALEISPGYPKASFYRAVADAQDGKTQQARAVFTALLEKAPADAPWRQAVERQLAALDASPGGPVLEKEQLQAAGDMTPEQRQQMIRGMVARLDARLHEDGDDIDGWLRLINARIVLGEREAASKALGDARRQFAGNEPVLTRLAQLADQLGLSE